MSFNLGISTHPTSRLGGLSSIGIYLYEDIYYRQWISEVALCFYEGRQDEFVWLDLVKQFRNPEKQQIIPLNLTKEIIDETSILYRNTPIYQVVDENGKILAKDTDLWEKIMIDCRYDTFMDKLDRWTKLLGTVLVKVSFVDPQSGQLVKENEGGQVHLDMLHGGVYDIRHGASPYYITEVLIGFGRTFNGFMGSNIDKVSEGVPSPSDLGQSSIEIKQNVGSPGRLGTLNRIYWSPFQHMATDKDGRAYKTENPYGIIPAVPFFNQDPAHYYFLPINEPLIYANHALNMRISDLNHIAKFQSFGIPVVKGIERPTSIRQGRPVDDFNILKGGGAQSRFGGIGGLTGFGAGGQFRTFDAGLGIFRDGNADAAALGSTIGPDTAIAVGEKGDFKFAHPNADILGLIKSIHSMSDMVRSNHGLRPKWEQSLPASGYSLMMEKMGVMEENIRRAKLFREREEQLFSIIKRLWNVHHSKQGDPKFNEDARLKVTFKDPEFPVDPKTKMESQMMENNLLDTGDRATFKKLYPHLEDSEINKLVAKRRKDKEEQAKWQANLDIEIAKIIESSGVDALLVQGVQSSNKAADDGKKKSLPGSTDNKAKKAEESGKKEKLSDIRKKDTKKEKSKTKNSQDSDSDKEKP